MRYVILPFALSLLYAQPAEETFVLLDGRSGKKVVENGERAGQRFTPCSTFKIPNSLIALETGVVPDTRMVIAYDPKRDGDQTGVWARDHDLRSALRYSVAWYYRELARRVRPYDMKRLVDGMNYGNTDVSGPTDRFWIGGSLRISAHEQVDFLRMFNESRLPVSRRAAQTIRDLLLLERTGAYNWYGKTGTCTDVSRGPVAWHVGFVEREGTTSYYALNFSGSSISELAARRPTMIRQKLAAAGLIYLAPPSREQQLQAEIRAALQGFPATVSLHAKNLDTGATFGVRSDERVRTASTIKLPIMAAVFAAVAAGKSSWTETVELRDSDKVSGSGILREMSAGLKLPLRDLVHLMIVVSDNTATNLILDRISADFVNTQLDSLGLHHTRALRKVMSGATATGHSREGLLPEFQSYGLGVSTPRDMVALLEKLEARAVVSADASAEMLAILGRQQHKDGIGRQYFDHRVVSKSGTLDRLRSDVGIIHSVGGRIALAITVDDMLRTDYSPDNAGTLLTSKLAALLVDGLTAPLSELGAPQRTVELKAAMDHVQGIEVKDGRLWVSWVDRAKKTGHVSEFDVSTGALVRSVPVHRGAQYHPSGLAFAAGSLWLAVAEYKPRSSSVVQRRNANTLELEAEFQVPDHIGCVAVGEGLVYGGNWDSRQIYTWNSGGRLVRKQDNPSGTRYQDMKWSAGQLIAGGLRDDGGAIDWLDPKNLRLARRIRTGKTNRGVLLTHEGMAVSGDRLYFLPEDQPSRLFVFALPSP